MPEPPDMEGFRRETMACGRGVMDIEVRDGTALRRVHAAMGRV
ncbi:hypothetical protein AB0C59_32635 [Streptomyces sp. NPDC048664]